MSRMIVDRQTRAKLRDLSERLEMCDETGRVLGVYVPLEDRAAYAHVDVPATPHELDQSEHEEARRCATFSMTWNVGRETYSRLDENGRTKAHRGLAERPGPTAR